MLRLLLLLHISKCYPFTLRWYYQQRIGTRKERNKNLQYENKSQ